VQSRALRFEAFRERVEHEFARALRYRHPVALIVLSVDGSERLAASYGEAAVDEFMGTLEETLRRCLRDVDLLYRAGPNEFAAILPETPAAGARIPADRFLTQTSRLVFKPSGATTRPVLPFKATSSVGVADGPGHGVASAEELVQSARASMGSARVAGGARVCVHDVLA
jgi:diguanylate cyclase (GGDEF)-like protein